MSMSTLERSVSTVVVNYNTPDLLRDAVTSFRKFYPSVPVIIVDNGSDSPSREAIKQLVTETPNVISATYLPENIFHGPAMHHALEKLTTDFVFVLDSDTVTTAGDFLDAMIDNCSNPDVYAVGQTATVNKRGFATADGDITVPVSAYMLIDRKKYLELPPFIHHGLPVLNNMVAARKRGWSIVNFPIDKYIEHLGRGTATKFGYGLGWRSKLDYVLNKLKL